MVAVGSIALLWTLQFVSFSLDRLLHEPDKESWLTLQARSVVTLAGAVISFAIFRILQRCNGVPFLRRAVIALALALAGATIHGVINWLIFSAFFGDDPASTFTVGSFASLIYLFSWVYLAMTVILLSLTYGDETLRRERRISELTWETERAQLEALRYQLNPHFLFNALNSAASLISARRNRDAEAMLENLADFLRTTVKLDAGKDIPLREELGLQSAYLNIEQCRFPHRLSVETEVPDDLLDVLVPNLITQPLVENSIKHAVARSAKPVAITISARETGGKLELRVRDSGAKAGPLGPNGASAGLQNVEKRLKLRFGSEASFQAGALMDGGFETVMLMPIRRSE